MTESPKSAGPIPEPAASQTRLGTGGETSSGYVSKKREGKTLSDTTLHLAYKADEVRSALGKAIRRGDEHAACWWALQLIRHDWCRYLWNALRVIVSEDVGVACPEAAVWIDALASNAEKGTDGFKKKMFVGICEMQAIVLLCRAPKCHTAVNALLTCAKMWRQVERGEIEPPPIPDYAIDSHTRRGRTLKVPKSVWWLESVQLSPKGKTHAENGGDPFAAIEGDSEVLDD
jgi:hypothetical protein